MTTPTWPEIVGLILFVVVIAPIAKVFLHTWVWYDKWPWDVVDSPESMRRTRWTRGSSLDMPQAPPANIRSLDEARSAACAALGLGSEWSAEPATPLGVLLKETPVTIPQLRARIQSLYGRDIGDVDEATPVGAVARAIYLPFETPERDGF